MGRLSISIASMLFLGACGGATQSSQSSRHANVPAVITAQNYEEVERAFFKLSLDDPDRAEVRERLVSTLVEELRPYLERNDYNAVVDTFERAMELYAPEDFDAHLLSASLRNVAGWLVQHGSSRSDEGTVLGALRVLASLDSQSDASARYQALAAWSAEVRENLGSPVDRYEGWVHAWQEHARLSPSQDVLDALVQLYSARRDAYARMLSEQPMHGLLGGVSMQDFRAANYASLRTPYDVAAAFLMVADFASAEARLRTLAPMNGTTEARLADVIAIARRDDLGDARDAILTLARGYMQPDIGRPDVARAVCRAGNRRFTDDARFPQCLAEVAAILGNARSAAAYYREAIALRPDELRLYEEALATIDTLLRSDARDGAQTEALARDGLDILRARNARFADVPSQMTGDRLQFALAHAALLAGRLEDAEQALQESLRMRENVDALLELGRLYARTSRNDRAIEAYRRALDLIPPQLAHGDPSNPNDASSVNAQLQEWLALAYFDAGNQAQGRRLSEQARNEWATVARTRGGDLRFEAWVHVGILSGRLGQADRTREAFRSAIVEGTSRHDLYARMLSFLVVADTPDLELTYEMYRSALRQASPDREWKVYFALWVKTVAARAHQPVDRELDEDLRRVAGGDSWSGQLARFGLDELDGSALYAAASNNGEQTEAVFYDGIKKLAANDVAGARAAFTRVRASRLVSFYEYEMAEALEPKLAATP